MVFAACEVIIIGNIFVGIAVINLVESEFEVNGGRVLIADTDSPLCRVVETVCVIVDVGIAEECAPLVVPLLFRCCEPPLLCSVGICESPVAANIVIGTAAD